MTPPTKVQGKTVEPYWFVWSPAGENMSRVWVTLRLYSHDPPPILPFCFLPEDEQ